MAILDKSRVLAAKLETVFNVAETLTAADTVQVKGSSKLDAKMDSVERAVITDSLLKTAPINVRENTSGNLDFELMPSGTGDDILGDVLWEAGFGVKNPAGQDSGFFVGYSDAGTTSANEIYEAQSGDTGTATGYTLSGTTDATKSLTLKQFIGTNKSLETTGNVVSAVDISIPTADVATVSFSVEGCGFTTNNADTKLTPACVTALPYLGKSAVFSFDNNTLSATDVSIKIANTIYNEEGITSAGYTSKQITGKDITGSFTILFEDYSMLTKLQNNISGSLYIELNQGTNKFGVYIPALKLTSFGASSNNGVMTQQVDFAVVYDCSTTTEPIIVAQEVA